jgi:hypothetical protein
VRPNKSIEHLMDHIISEGTRIFSGTKRADTWMIYHDHLKIWWEKQSQDYLKSLPCPIEGWWHDRQIFICGKTNNALVVSKSYNNCLPGDNPELMPLDCHLFADLQEGAAKNVALTYHISKDDKDFADKYSFATPHQVFSALQRTIQSGCPSEKRIEEDMFCIFNETLDQIIVAEGIYIEDTSKKIWKGARGALQTSEEKEWKQE